MTANLPAAAPRDRFAPAILRARRLPRPVRLGAAALTAALTVPAVTMPARAQPDGPPPEAVRVRPVLAQSVQERRLVTGELRAVHRSGVAAQEAGRVVEVLVREGERVSAGDVLARLDARRLEIMLREIETNGLAATALLAERRAEAAWRGRDVELLRSSLDRGAANPRELRDAESAVAMAEARVAQAEAAVALNEVNADLLRVRLADTVVTAPFDGVAVACQVDPGEWVGEGDTLVDLISIGSVEAWVNVPQRFLGNVRDGRDPVLIRVDPTGRTHTIDGHRIVPQVDPRARAFTLVATIDDEAGRLAPGMSVTGWVPTGAMSDQLTLASDAVLRNESGPYVYVVRGGGDGPAVAMPAAIEVLFPLGDRLVVRSGQLRAGDRVVVEGNERLFPSRPVTPIEAEAPGDAP